MPTAVPQVFLVASFGRDKGRAFSRSLTLASSILRARRSLPDSRIQLSLHLFHSLEPFVLRVNWSKGHESAIAPRPSPQPSAGFAITTTTIASGLRYWMLTISCCLPRFSTLLLVLIGIAVNRCKRHWLRHQLRVRTRSFRNVIRVCC